MLGRRWLGETGSDVTLTHGDLRARLGLEELYLSLGLSRGYQGQTWLLVIGVHCVPDYAIEMDYRNL